MDKEKTVVIKIGSALMVDEVKRDKIFDVIEEIQKRCKVVIVASGAVGFGRERAPTLENKQTLAALGQTALMEHFITRFSNAAQVLLNHEDLSNGTKRKNAASTIKNMLQNDIIPVVNENDTTSTEELNFGDNDQLSSHVAEFINADQLFMLTGSDGVKDAKNQNIVSLDMKMLSKRSLESFEAKCVQEKSTQGRGGIISKVIAAIRANQAGIETFIVNGSTPEFLQALSHNDESQEGAWTKIINQLSDEQIKILEGYIEDKKQRDPGFEVPEWNYTNTA